MVINLKQQDTTTYDLFIKFCSTELHCISIIEFLIDWFLLLVLLEPTSIEPQSTIQQIRI